MKICFYGINFSPEKTGIGKYSGELVEYLAKQGHELRVITALPYYPEWSVSKPYKAGRYQTEKQGNMTVHRCPLFVPKKPGLVTRLIHLLSFALSSLPVVFRLLFWRPEVVITVVPTNFILPGSLFLSKVSGAKNWCHIQDYEIDAMFELGMAARLAFLKKTAFLIESFLLKRFDVVSSISGKMIKQAEAKGVDPKNTKVFPNWANLEAIKYISEPEFRKLQKIDGSTRLILYSGNLGNKQGLEFIPMLAKNFMDKGIENAFFFVVGEGSYKDELQKMGAGLSNLAFLPLQELKILPDMLSSADIHLVLQKRGAADNVLPSKLTNILAVGGNALITADSETELGVVVANHPGLAFLAEPENFEAFSDKILELLNDLPEKPNKVAIEYAKNYLDRNQILKKFEEQLIELAD